MREILTIHVGQCGNSIAREFWRTISSEHAIDPASGLFYSNARDIQMLHADVYYDETMSRHVPRSVLIDLKTETIDSIRSSTIGRLFRPDSFVVGDSGIGSANNFAKGFYSYGSQILSASLNAIRKEVERCDSLSGIQILHAIGGGTGSGLGSLLLDNLRTEFKEQVLGTYTVFPTGGDFSDAVIEPFNTVFAMNHLIPNSEFNVCFDNDALFEICQNKLGFASPTFSETNGLISRAIAGVTASHRFPGQMHSSLRKLITNLIPFPKLHFLATSCAPLGSQMYARPQHAHELISELLDPHALMCGVHSDQGQYVAATAMFRGNSISSLEADAELAMLMDRESDNFLPWLPNSFCATACDEPAAGWPASATMLGNTTSIRHLFGRHGEHFKRLYARKAFLHWYTAEGMDETEFVEAIASLDDLCAEYSACESHVSLPGEGCEGASTRKKIASPRSVKPALRRSPPMTARVSNVVGTRIEEFDVQSVRSAKYAFEAAHGTEGEDRRTRYGGYSGPPPTPVRLNVPQADMSSPWRASMPAWKSPSIGSNISGNINSMDRKSAHIAESYRNHPGSFIGCFRPARSALSEAQNDTNVPPNSPRHWVPAGGTSHQYDDPRMHDVPQMDVHSVNAAKITKQTEVPEA